MTSEVKELDDLISRQAAIDAMINSRSNADVTLVPGSYTNGWRDGRKLLLDELLQVVFELPSAQPGEDIRAMCGECDAWNQYKNYPQPGWIPTSEKLPEGIGQAIVQTNGGAIHEVFYKGKNDYGHEVWMRLDGDIYWDDEVVAWMPLPTPYLEGGLDESDD